VNYHRRIAGILADLQLLCEAAGYDPADALLSGAMGAVVARHGVEELQQRCRQIASMPTDELRDAITAASVCAQDLLTRPCERPS
jgi:hypothetical protein